MPTETIITRIPIPTLRYDKIVIPATCPGCGANLTEPGSLRECGYVSYFSECHVDDMGEVVGEDEFEHDFSDNMVTSIVCTGCNKILSEEG